MLELFNKDRQKIAVLQNAFDISESVKINGLNSLSFSLPIPDPKNKQCRVFNTVRYNNGDVYRIVGIDLDRSDTGQHTYSCEHILASLLDDALYGYHVVGGQDFYTQNVINYVLAGQTTENWVLDRCDFNRQYEYGWEQENLLNAVLSVPNLFSDRYMWECDTTSYPYKLSLSLIDENELPAFYIRGGHNMTALTRPENSSNIATRLYLNGAGEGINQVNIKAVNNGIPYLQSSPERIAEYGLITKIFTDRQYENPQSLKEFGTKLLKGLEQPYVEYSVDFASLSVGDFDYVKVGNFVSITDSESQLDIKRLIVGIDKTYNDITQSRLYIANKPQDIADSIADLANRQRIEQTYSQGATQIYADSIADNADFDSPLDLRFYIPRETLVVNRVSLRVELGRFRAYSGTTDAGGNVKTETASSSKSSTEGGSTTTQSASSSKSSSEGGSTETQSANSSKSSVWGGNSETSGTAGSTTIYGGDFVTSGQSSQSTSEASHTVEKVGLLTRTTNTSTPTVRNHTHTAYHGLIRHEHVMRHHHSVDGEHSHRISGHTHRVDNEHSHDIEHTHKVNTKHSHDIRHTHKVNTRHRHDIKHTHKVDIEHDHRILPKIQLFSGADGCEIYVNRRLINYFNSRSIELDITDYLVEDGKIPRGRWHTISVKPSTISRVEMQYNVQSFVQSRGNMTV